MAPNSLFGHGANDDEPAVDAPTAPEGVRLLPPDEVAKAAERAETAKRRGPDEKKYGDRPEAPPKNVKPAMRFPLADTADPNDFERPRMAPVTPPTADDPTGSRTVLSVGPPTGETAMPHWTEPATGEVPRVLIGEDGEIGESDDDKWAAYAASAPRWKDENTDWDLEEHTFDDLVEHGEERLGALDETERQMDEDYLTFEDLEVPEATLSQAPVRGSASDPIKIQRSGRAPLSSAGPSGNVAPLRPTRAPGATERPAPPGGATGPVAATAPSSRDQQEAIRIGVFIAGGALVIFLVGFWLQWFPLILIAGAIVFAIGELFNATERAGFRPIKELGLVAAVAMPVAAYFAGTPANPAGESGMMLVLFLSLAACMAWYLFGAGRGRPVANIAITLTGIVYVAVTGAYAALILRIGPIEAGGANKGVQLFILIALGTTMCDVGGYLLGSRIGRTPLSAASPNKTREGLIAGMAVSVLVVVLVGGVAHLGVSSMSQALALGVAIAVMAPLGDLFESMVKRDLGVKDMGDVIPSHGGVLDRLDAYLFTLPAAYYVLRMLGLV